MRAMRIEQPGGLDRIVLGQAETVALGKGDIRVRLHASSLNYHDYMVAAGFIPAADGRIPMSDGAGEVIEVGEDVSEFKAGDRVMGTFFPNWLCGEPTQENVRPVPGDSTDGFACEEIVAPATAFTMSPAGYSYAEAATIPCAAVTVWRALFVEAMLLPGETVLVQGTGGVSIFALQLAKASGARVIATSSSAEKLERLRAMGADHVINYKEDLAWGETARRLTGGRGVDHVVEVGGATIAQSIAACRPRGHIGLIGIVGGRSADMPVLELITGNVRLSGLMVGSRAHQIATVRAIEACGIKPVIDRSFPLEGLADAFRYQETGRHFGKICIEW